MRPLNAKASTPLALQCNVRSHVAAELGVRNRLYLWKRQYEPPTLGESGGGQPRLRRPSQLEVPNGKFRH